MFGGSESVARFMPLLIIGFALIMCPACRTPEGPGGDSLASIQVSSDDYLAIARAISKQFQEAGYQPTPLPSNRGMKMMFEKEGTTKDSVLYSDWSFATPWYRAKIDITPLRTDSGPRTYLVTCNVFRVLNRGERHFEEEHRLRSARRAYFQGLLDQAKAEVASPGISE
jgi:hypothetical protein